MCNRSMIPSWRSSYTISTLGMCHGMPTWWTFILAGSHCPNSQTNKGEKLLGRSISVQARCWQNTCLRNHTAWTHIPTKEKNYWDDSFLLKLDVDRIQGRCVPDEEIPSIIFHCHSSPYGDHAFINNTTAKVLQSGSSDPLCSRIQEIFDVMWSALEDG
jgi:hypothetical protein